MGRFQSEKMAAWTGGTWSGTFPACVSAVSTDTRSLQPDSLYVAIKGERFDGHDFVVEALAGGAAGAMVMERRPAWDVDVPLLVVADTAEALMRLARGYRRQVAPLTVGITGSAGKTTVKELLGRLLAADGVTAATRGNWNNQIGLPLSLLAMAPETRYGVFELGTNHPGEIGQLCEILEPEWGVVTAIGPGHLEFFGSVEAVADEKATLLRRLPAAGTAVLDADDAFFEQLGAQTTATVVSVSALGNTADYAIQEADPAPEGVRVRERASGETAVLAQPLPGQHQRVNLLLAVAVARRAGLGWQTVDEVLRRPVRLPMRWERQAVEGIAIVNDAYNANPLSVRAAVKTFAEEPCEGRHWLVLGDMLELGDAALKEHRDLGAALAGGAWEGIAGVGDLGREIVAGARAAGWPADRAWCAGTPAEAAAAIGDRLREGDVVLLKASRRVGLERFVDVLRKGRT